MLLLFTLPAWKFVGYDKICLAEIVSIHAPCMGNITKGAVNSRAFIVSIHAPSVESIKKLKYQFNLSQFQFMVWGHIIKSVTDYKNTVSIHAPHSGSMCLNFEIIL